MHTSIWYFASWNVRTLLDVEGSIETAKQVMESESDLPDEQKIDQVVDGLKHYCINVTGLQETKWFGAKEYRSRRQYCVDIWKGDTIFGKELSER